LVDLNCKSTYVLTEVLISANSCSMICAKDIHGSYRCLEMIFIGWLI